MGLVHLQQTGKFPEYATFLTFKFFQEKRISFFLGKMTQMREEGD